MSYERTAEWNATKFNKVTSEIFTIKRQIDNIRTQRNQRMVSNITKH